MGAVSALLNRERKFVSKASGFSLVTSKKEASGACSYSREETRRGDTVSSKRDRPQEGCSCR